MNIKLSEQCTTWLNAKIHGPFDENTKFSFKFGAVTKNGVVDAVIDLDLCWLVLIHIEDTQETKLQIVKELLQNPLLLGKFQATIDNLAAKRLIAEFLMFNFIYIDGLKPYIDFAKLSEPIDFISHALFIKRGEGVDSHEINLERLKIVNTVLDSSFKLPPNSPVNAEGAVLRRVLLMYDVPDKFKIATKLLAAGFRLFNNNMESNAEIAIFLIDSRDKPECKTIINQHLDQFKNISLQVAGNGNNGNLADYYYWVKEEMTTVRYVKETFSIELSPPT